MPTWVLKCDVFENGNLTTPNSKIFISIKIFMNCLIIDQKKLTLFYSLLRCTRQNDENKGNYLYWEWRISFNVLSENIVTLEAITFPKIYLLSKAVNLSQTFVFFFLWRASGSSPEQKATWQRIVIVRMHPQLPDMLTTLRTLGMSFLAEAGTVTADMSSP